MCGGGREREGRGYDVLSTAAYLAEDTIGLGNIASNNNQFYTSFSSNRQENGDNITHTPSHHTS